MPDAEAAANPNSARAVLEQAVRAAGAAALGFYGRSPQSWSKADNSPVSEADLAADMVLKQRLGAAFPGYGWLSEESPPEPAAGMGRLWIVDPIDGTSAFLAGKPEWAVSVALVEDGRPVLGAVFNPVTEQYFDAALNAGASLNGAPIQVSARDTIAGARLIAFENGLRSRRWRVGWPEVTATAVNSMAYRLCLVAAGRYDATLSASGKSDWDLAAADLIVHEAGGRATTFTGAQFIYGEPSARHPNVVGAGPALHDAMLAHIACSWQA